MNKIVVTQVAYLFSDLDGTLLELMGFDIGTLYLDGGLGTLVSIMQPGCTGSEGEAFEDCVHASLVCAVAGLMNAVPNESYTCLQTLSAPELLELYTLLNDTYFNVSDAISFVCTPGNTVDDYITLHNLVYDVLIPQLELNPFVDGPYLINHYTVANYLHDELVACNFTCTEEVQTDFEFLNSDPFIEIPPSSTKITDVTSTTGNCFVFGAGNSSGQHKITVYVDQPVVNTRTPWDAPTNVGHAFIGMEQVINGETNRLVLGHYPETGGKPWVPDGKGELRYDGTHSYDVSITAGIEPWQFDLVRLSILEWDEEDHYNLNSNNCVNFAVTVFATIGIQLPMTSQTWPMGGGPNPGDLGEDLRSMPLLPNMTRNTVPGNAPSTTCN